MTVGYVFHDACYDHETPPGHPERRKRYTAVKDALQGLDLDRIEAPLAEDKELLRCHPQAYIDRVRAAVPNEGTDFKQLDADTWLSPGSWDAALRAVGGAVEAVNRVMAGDLTSAFVGCRPPGHHAEQSTPMGFCLFGTVAIAAKRALIKYDRVAIVDFDVHHGNGTQALVSSESRVMFASSHQYPLWPGTGAASDRGMSGHVRNYPLPAGSDGRVMRETYETILPQIADFKPEMILVSAGFDAHADDPLAGLNWDTEDFRWLTTEIAKLATNVCEGRIVSCLEGGYDLDALGASVRAHVEALIAADT